MSHSQQSREDFTSLYRGLTTRCKQKDQIRVCQKTSKKKNKQQLYSPGTASYGHTSQRSTCTRVMGREEHEEGKELLTISEVFWATLSAHIQPNASEFIGRRYVSARFLH